MNITSEYNYERTRRYTWEILFVFSLQRALPQCVNEPVWPEIRTLPIIGTVRVSSCIGIGPRSTCIATKSGVWYRSGYDVWAFEFVPDRSWHRPSGIVSKESGCDGRTRLDWTTSSGDAGTCSVREIFTSSTVSPSLRFPRRRADLGTKPAGYLLIRCWVLIHQTNPSLSYREHFCGMVQRDR